MILLQEFSDSLDINLANASLTRGRKKLTFIDVKINFKDTLRFCTLVSNAVIGRVILPNPVPLKYSIGMKVVFSHGLPFKLLAKLLQ